MKLTALFLLVFSGTSQAIARPVGLSMASAMGDATATGYSAPAPSGIHRKRPLAFPPIPPEIRIGARAYPSGLQIVSAFGNARTRAGARAAVDGMAVRSTFSPVRPSGAARVAVLGLSAEVSTFDARAVGAGVARPAGLPTLVELGISVGHPTEQETRTRLEAEFDDDLFLVAALDDL